MDITDKNLESTTAHIGYSDEKLELLSNAESRFERGIAPWATWESENSSFGKTFRKWANYPAVLPLYICSDHGVNWGSRCWPNETENRFATYFTWNKKKNDLMRKNHGKNSYHVPHPWVFYRKKYFPVLPKHRSGTLVFYAHSNSMTTPVYDDLDKYINDLKTLPEKYQPIVICIMADDIKKGLHKELRKYQLPLVTAGNLSSKNFVDRFYSLIYQFRYSSSANIGSHTYYIVEAGVPFFIYGPYPEYHIRGSKFVKDGKQDLRDYGDDEDFLNYSRLKELLSSQKDEITPEQYSLVSKHLGMDSEVTRFKGALILWQAFFRSGEVIANCRRLAGAALRAILR